MLVLYDVPQKVMLSGLVVGPPLLLALVELLMADTSVGTVILLVSESCVLTDKTVIDFFISLPLNSQYFPSMCTCVYLIIK